MKAPELIARCFAARTAAHMAHLQTTSYAAHAALGEFYESIVDLADSFAEAYQGMYGVIAEYPASPIPSGQPTTWLPLMRSWVRANRDDCADGKSELANLIDEIIAQLDKTLYKLKTIR